MQETSCQINIVDLGQKIIETGDIDSLLILAREAEKRVQAGKNDLDGLDTLVIYYLYYVWMDSDMKKNFPSMKNFVLLDYSKTWVNIITNFNEVYDWNNTNRVSDIYLQTLNDIASDIVYRMTKGKCGNSRKDKFIFPVIQKMFDIRYSTIPDFILKLLFIGYDMYGKDLFHTDLEFIYFESFLSQKSNLVYCSKENESTFEELVLEMNLV